MVMLMNLVFFMNIKLFVTFCVGYNFFWCGTHQIHSLATPRLRCAGTFHQRKSVLGVAKQHFSSDLLLKKMSHYFFCVFSQPINYLFFGKIKACVLIMLFLFWFYHLPHIFLSLCLHGRSLSCDLLAFLVCFWCGETSSSSQPLLVLGARREEEEELPPPCCC